MLPAVYRIRDFQEGEPLKALLSLIVEQIEALEEDLAQLYDDQFIETCADWVIPYIGDLVGYRSLHDITPAVSRPRAEVANLIAFRRRKGTVSILEELAHEVTGWDSRVVEFFQLLATTQYMNHLRPKNQVYADLRNWRISEYLNTPFDQTPHLADVRNISSSRGRYNIPNIGVFLWRLYAYPIKNGTAFEIQPGCYTFEPLGKDIPLFNSPQSEEEIIHIAEPVNVPEAIKQRPLLQDLELFRQTLTDTNSVQTATDQSLYFGRNPVFAIYKNKELIPAEEIVICDLSKWDRPSGNIRYYPQSVLTDPDNPSTDPDDPAPVDYSVKVAVDPLLGRLTFAESKTATDSKIEVSYFYGFSEDMGGGGYIREDSSASIQAAVIKVTAGDQTLSQTIDKLSNGSESSDYKNVQNLVMEIESNSTFEENLEITLEEGQKLTIRGGKLFRPVLKGIITINSAEDSEIIFDGLLISNGIEIKGTAASTVTLRHCTLSPWLTRDPEGMPVLPEEPSLKWDAPESSGNLIIDHTITGRLILSKGVSVGISDSIIDGLQENNILIAANEDGNSPSGKVTVFRSTLIGKVEVQEIELAENSIFLGKVNSKKKQQGCIRFCYLSPGSHVPHRYYCQPDLAIKQAQDCARKKSTDISESTLEQISKEIQSWLKPVFTARIYGHPGYSQLHGSCPPEIRTGADDGSEMGVFHNLYINRRETNLRVRLDEYLRFGLEAGIFYIN
jgi:cytoskeletal protein CcmA (bactofilin family)